MIIKSFAKLKIYKLLDVESNDLYLFNGKKLISSKTVNKQHYKDLNENDYLKFFKKEYSTVDKKYLENYFVKSNFKDNLVVYISLTDDNFKSLNLNYSIDFSGEKIIFKSIDNLSEKKVLNNKTSKDIDTKDQKREFLNTIYNKLPWEDLLIGFQCKVIRSPNIYNVNFWYHFTNKYITLKICKIENKL